VRLLILLVAAVVLITLLVAFRAQRKQKQEELEHQGLDQFIAEYRGQDFAEESLRCIHHYLAQRRPDHVIVHASDPLTIYGLVELDLEDAVLEIVDRCRGELPGTRELDTLKPGVRTVDDLVRFVDPLARHKRNDG
jgi:hypothetical protein